MAISKQESKERTAKMLAEYQAGKNFAQIAGSFGIDKGSVRSALRRSGITFAVSEQRRKEADQAKMMEAARLYKSGLGMREIEALMHVSYTTLNRMLRNSGVQIRPKGGNFGKSENAKPRPPSGKRAIAPQKRPRGMSQAEIDEACRLYKQGANVKDLFKQFGVSRVHLTDVLRRALGSLRGDSSPYRPAKTTSKGKVSITPPVTGSLFIAPIPLSRLMGARA
jgi:transposase